MRWTRKPKWSSEAQRRYDANIRSGLAHVPTIPDELHAVLFSGQEPTPELEAQAAEQIKAACEAIREKNLRPRRPLVETEEDL